MCVGGGGDSGCAHSELLMKKEEEKEDTIDRFIIFKGGSVSVKLDGHITVKLDASNPL